MKNNSPKEKSQRLHASAVRGVLGLIGWRTLIWRAWQDEWPGGSPDAARQGAAMPAPSSANSRYYRVIAPCPKRTTLKERSD